MPDITMCKDKDCNLKLKCYRYTAKPDRYQSFFGTEVKVDKNVCEYFWSNKGR